MTTNSRRKAAIRAIAASEGISYTEAMRTLDRTDAQATLLSEILNRPDLAADPVPTTGFAVHFALRDDLSAPYDLAVDPSGLVHQQSFWRGAKFHILGFRTEPGVGTIDVRWSQAAVDPSLAVGTFPVIADVDGTWSTWGEKVAEILPADLREPRYPITAVITPLDAAVAPSRVRVEEFYAALGDEDHREIVRGDFVADDRVADIILRAARLRGDVGAVRIADWVDDQADADPETWDETEPYTVRFEASEVAAFSEHTRLYPQVR